MSVIFEKYLSESNSDYVGVYEPSGSVDGVSYGYVGNNSSLAGFFLLFKLTADFPFAGVTIGRGPSSAERVETAILRMAEVNDGTRGSNPLTLKVSPISGAWDGAANFANIPAYRTGVLNEYSAFGDIPSYSNYDDRFDKRYRYDLYSDGQHDYRYFTSYQGPTVVINGYTFVYDGITYFTYVKYHNINITDVIKDCITNGATGLICYFDIANGTYNRKVFETTVNTVIGRQPKLTISLSDEIPVTNPPIKIAAATGAIDKQVLAGKIFDEAAWKGQVGRKIFDGANWKTVF